MKKFAINGSGVIIEEESRTNVQTGIVELDSYSLSRYYNNDARNLDFLPNNSIDFILTSPPYNVGIPYNSHNDSMNSNDYAVFVEEFLTEYYRVLASGGRIAIVIANSGRNPYISNTVLYTQIAEKIGFIKRGEIIWVKGDVPNVTSWGSWCSASNPGLRDSNEYILVFHKESARSLRRGTSTIDKDLFLSCSNSVWRVNPTTKKRSDGHPAAFPQELAERLIQFYTFKEDVVLDPMCGRGTTCLAAEKLGRRWIGNDIDLSYVNSRMQKENNKNNRIINKQIRTDKTESIGLTPTKLLETRLKADRKRMRQKKIDQKEEQ